MNRKEPNRRPAGMTRPKPPPAPPKPPKNKSGKRGIMNCVACKHCGNCLMWKAEKEYFDRYPNVKPPKNLHRLFEVTEQGARCPYFKECKEKKHKENKNGE